MQGPAVDIVILLLIMLFFGMQQRRRPELFFRFWLAGWVMISLGMMVGAVPLTPTHALRWDNVMRTNRMMLGGMVFLLSFIATRERLRNMVLIGLTFAVPAIALLDADILARPPFWLLASLLLIGQAAAIHAVYVLLNPAWRWRRRSILAICVGFGAAMLVLLPGDAGQSLPNLLLAEIFLSAAVLYGGAHARRSVAAFGGALGFFAWGAFYLAALWLPRGSDTARVFYEFWSVPKYFVGFAMILQIFELSSTECARLAEVYRTLYEDFRLMYENHPHPMCIYDGATNRLLSANVAATASYGFTEQELIGMRMSDLELPVEAEAEATMLVEQTADGQRIRHRRKDGSVLWVHVVDRAMWFQGRQARLVIARDITQQLHTHRELAHRAHHDALTGLPNRVLLEDHIRQCFDRCSKDERKAVLLTIDIDHFKRINDTYGHHVGDECLKAVASRLKTKIRQVDTIARTGGEEFVAIVGGLRNASDARKVTASLLCMFEAPLRLSCGVIPVTVSLGGAVFPDDGIEIAELQVKSDQALYEAKRTGRNCAVFASPEVALSLAVSQPVHPTQPELTSASH
jgi:diguanylate cyclase (GGDEF)-like protein/PAS domain S-box-containing protein